MPGLDLAFDLLLAAVLLWTAWWTLAAATLVRGAILFVVFSLQAVLAWLRLSAPDLALAEAAVGAGITGVLIIDTLGRLVGHGSRRD